MKERSDTYGELRTTESNPMNSLSLQRSNELIRHAIEKAAADYGRPICVAICDTAGFLVAFQRVEGSPIRSIAISQAKAYSAARMQANTDALLERLRRENIVLSYFCDDRLTALPGGSVIKNIEGVTVGAVGVSGLAAAEDQQIANHVAGLAGIA
jgi:glc operon protein GlcG